MARRGCPQSLGFGHDRPASALLMHDDEMPTLLEISIHRAARKWPPLPKLAFLRSLESVLKLRAHIGVVENLATALDHRLINDFSHGAEIIEGVHGTPGIPPFEIAWRSAAILRRTGLVAIHAKRMVSRGHGFQAFFEPDFMPPRNVQIIFVDEARSFAKAQAFDRHLRRPSGHFPGAVPNRTQAELKEMNLETAVEP